MKLIIKISEEEFKTGKLIKENPPVIEFGDSNGWIRKVNANDFSKCSQFTQSTKTFLSELIRVLDNFVG